MNNVGCRCGWEGERYGPWGSINDVSPCPECDGMVRAIPAVDQEEVA